MRRTVMILADDLDPGQAADETVCFGLDGQCYEIDLSKAHAAELREQFGRYANAARQVRAAVRWRTMAERRRSAEIRAWAVGQGLLAPGSIGRLPVSVLAGWRAR